MRLAMFQGVLQKDKRSRAAERTRHRLSRRTPRWCACAFHKTRVYLFTRREPEDGDDAVGGRDVFNGSPWRRRG